MHRHGYQGRKFGRERDQRRALLRSLADSLVLHESIETTLSKAKEIIPYVEKLVTKAKKGDVHSRRQVIDKLQTKEAAHKLFDELAVKLQSRSSGHLRIERTRIRRGDNTQMARVSFIFDEAKPAKQATTKPTTTSARKTRTAVTKNASAKTTKKKEAVK
ncbi:MAG: 50S ribosomal protein L17 [Candidatus Saccharibacteria bacterium]|nr:50S ribosomal protein L17 [Candidatus Saccharibacteria bacterium]